MLFFFCNFLEISENPWTATTLKAIKKLDGMEINHSIFDSHFINIESNLEAVGSGLQNLWS